MAEKLAFLLNLQSERLSRADSFWNNKELKQFLINFAEVPYLLRDAESYESDQNLLLRSWFTDLRNLAYDVDELMDDWEQSEISKPKFQQEVRRIDGLLAQLLNSFYQLVAELDREMISFSEVSYGKSDEDAVFERHDETFTDIIYSMFLPYDNSVRIIPIVGRGGIGKTVIAERIYNDKKVKTEFPLRAWVSVHQNLDVSIITKELRVQFLNKRVDPIEVSFVNERMLIVLDDVGYEDAEELERLRLSISDMCVIGSCVLVTTRNDRVAALLGTVPVHYLTFSQPELTESLRKHSPLQAHKKDMKRKEPEIVLTTEAQRPSNSRFNDDTLSDLLRHTVPTPYSESDTSLDPVSSTENLIEDEITTPLQVDTPYAESMSAVNECPASSPENLIKDEMTCLQPMKTMKTLTENDSEIKVASLEARELPAHVPQTVATTSDGKGKEGECKAILVSNRYVQQSVEHVVPMETIKLGTSDVTAEKSIKKSLQKIFKYVNDAKVSKIGVHGTGGIGKTTVLKALINYPKMKSMFRVIILVTVSRYWKTRKIQNEILRQLSLSREDYETDLQVAEKLLQVLKEKKFLLLLDDVWEHIDLGAVGIPLPSLENECKLIVASRELDVCRNMNVSKVIELETLPWKEAWKLFYKELGRIIHSPDVQLFAEAIVKGCCGLPLLIIATARALMEENNISVWEHASKKFSLPTTAIGYHTKDVIQLLKFSFDQLKDHDTKCCFLYCGLFPEDQEVNIFQFIDYCIQEGIIGVTGADAHKRGHDIVDVLVHSCLLQVTELGNSIRMHGLIRDLALEILLLAAEDGQFLLRAYSPLIEPLNMGRSSSTSSLKSQNSNHQFLLGAGADLSEPPSEEEWNQAKMIFLMDNKLCTLPEKPDCPNLLTLFLQRNLQLRVISPSFFESMTALKVLNLSKTRIKCLPKTIVKLQNLKILILRECDRLVMLPSEVGSLECLEVLDLQGTKIDQLPDEIGMLSSLRYLDVFFYGSIDENEYVKLPCNLISSDTISGLQALEILSIVVYPGDERWYNDVGSVITEVNKLTKLSSLCFHFPEVEHVEIFLKESVAWKDQRITKFKFVVGHDVKSIISRVPDYVEFDYNQQDKCLRFVNGKNISPEVLQILARSAAFYLDHHLDINSLSDLEVSNINGLKFCIISECPGIKTVVDIKEHATTVFPCLENLSIHHLWNLTCICKGIVSDGSFAELRILSVHTCPKLEYIFTSSMIQFLTKLEELAVEDCPAIGSIILEGEGEIIYSSCITWPRLKKLRLHYLPGLVNIGRNAWPSLEYISFYDCPQLKKIGMDWKLKDSLIEIKAEKYWWDQLQWEDADADLLSHLEDRLTRV